MWELAGVNLEVAALEALEKLALAIIIAIPSRFVIAVIDRLVGKLFKKTNFDPTLETFTHKSVVTFLWIAAAGLILVVLGIDVSAVVASFGVGSFIIGFALKDTLGNLASGVLILFNKPFIVGDDIEIKGVRGYVKGISISDTKLVTKDRVKVTMPNSMVYSNPIMNYTAYADAENTQT